METTDKQPLLRDIIFSHMSMIPFGGIRVVKCIYNEKPVILYDQPYDHSLITIAASQLSILVFVNEKKIILPFTDTEEQIEVLQTLEDNGIMPEKEEWIGALVSHTPMITMIDNFFSGLDNERSISLQEPKTITLNQETIVFNQIVFTPKRQIKLCLFENNAYVHNEILYFQHPHDFCSTAKVIEEHNLFMPYQLFH